MGIYASGRIEADSAVRNWLKVGMALIALMVLVGGITRLTESGLSMVDWKPISGTLPPLNEAEWQASFEMYKESPEFKDLNSHFSLGDYKKIFFWEYLHRLLGRLIGIAFLVPFLYFLIRRKISKRLLPLLLLLLGLGAFQGVLGWYMVKSGLVNIPKVSHYRLAAHLCTAFLTISYVYWLLMRTSWQPKIRNLENAKSIRRWTLILLGTVFLQIIYGAFVAGKDLGLIHNTWPSMDGYFFHPAASGVKPFYMNFLINNSMIQFVHRTLGILLFFMVLGIWLDLRKSGTEALIKLGRYLLLVVFVQFILGVLNLIWHVPIVLGVLHQFMALVLLLLSVQLLYRRNFIQPA